MADGVADFVLQALGSRVEESIEGTAPEPRAHPNDDASNGKTGERVGVNQPGQIPDVASPDEGDAKNDDDGTPDVCGEVERVGFEGFADVLSGDFVESPGAGEVDGKSDEENEDRAEAGLDVNGAEEKTVEGLTNDVESSED